MGLSKEEKERRRLERRKIKWEKEHKTINEIVYKFCVDCKEFIFMDKEHFYPNDKNSIDGFSNRCKECDKKRSVKNRHDNIERSRKSSLDWNKRNSERMKEVNLNFRQNNMEHRYEYHKNWCEENPDRVKQYAKNHRIHDVSTKERISCWEVFNYQCAYCGISENESKEKYKERLHQEHVDNEGYNDLRNDIPACKMCNDRKNTFTLSEWYNKDNPVFTQERYDKIIWWTTEGYKDYIEDKPPYKYSRKRINRVDGTWYYMHEFWSVDEKRNPINCIATGNNKKEAMENIKFCTI